MVKIKKTILLAMLGIATAVGGGLYYQQQSEQEQLATRAQHILARGIALYEEDRYDEALQMLETMPAQAPPDWHFPYYKGMVLVQLKDYEDLFQAWQAGPVEELLRCCAEDRSGKRGGQGPDGYHGQPGAHAGGTARTGC